MEWATASDWSLCAQTPANHPNRGAVWGESAMLVLIKFWKILKPILLLPYIKDATIIKLGGRLCFPNCEFLPAGNFCLLLLATFGCIFRLSSLAELIWFSSDTVRLLNPVRDFCIVSPWLGRALPSRIPFRPSSKVYSWFSVPSYMSVPLLTCWPETSFQGLVGMAQMNYPCCR